MTDEVTSPPPQQPVSSKKEGQQQQRLTSANRSGGPKRSPSISNKSTSTSNPGAPISRNPSNRSTNSGKKQGAGNAAAAVAAESGSDTASKKSNDSKKPEQRRSSSSQGGQGGRPNVHRKGASQAQAPAPRPNAPAQQPSPLPAANPSDAMSSLQRVIADLKVTPTSANPGANMAPSQSHPSGLPLNAPVFQPGATAYPGVSGDAKHRKAASMGASGLSGNFGSFAPHLGAMMEIPEDGYGGSALEERELAENFYAQQPVHQPRSQSQSFTAPRFAALAQAQQEQDALGPTGRPQLAPGFMFGQRKRDSAIAPPINEEDLGFQFPQQTQQSFSQDSVHEQQGSRHRKTESQDINGVMAEQVCQVLLMVCLFYLNDFFLDRHPATDRSPAAATAGALSATTGYQSSSLLPDTRPDAEPRRTQTCSEHRPGLWRSPDQLQPVWQPRYEHGTRGEPTRCPSWAWTSSQRERRQQDVYSLPWKPCVQ